MPNILILGASGLLGTALTQSLLRTGTHRVFAQTRTAEKVKSLLASEVTPIVFPLTDSAALKSAIATHDIDTVVDVSQAYQESTSVLQTIISASKERQSTLAALGAIGPKLGFVYTSGIMVHGSPKKNVSDLSPVGNSLASAPPAMMVSWRPAHEQAILAAREDLDVAIMRPGMLFGRGAWNFGPWWGPIAAAKATGGEKIELRASKEARFGLVHVDDVAEAYTAAIGRIDGRLGNWPVFDFVTELVGLEDVMSETLKSQGLKANVDFVGSGGDVMMEGLGLRARGDAARAKSVLGWDPKRRNFLLDVGVYYAAWETAAEMK